MRAENAAWETPLVFDVRDRFEISDTPRCRAILSGFLGGVSAFISNRRAVPPT
jgi:hypothetical protein